MIDYDKNIRGEKEKRKNIAILVSIIIIILLAVNLYNINYRQEESNFKAEKGILDLSSWEKHDEIIKLDGEWEFYSGQLIETGKELDKQEKTYIEVPEDSSYAIKSRTIRAANRIYL